MKTKPLRLHEVPLLRRRGAQCSNLPLPLGMVLVGCASGALAGLRNLAIAVIGCGSVGSRVAVLLARMGVGTLLLIDPKNYKAASLATHEIGPADVGRPKARVTGRRCKAISPSSIVRVLVGPVQALDLADLADVDLVVMAPDLLAVEVWLGQRCLWLGKPLVQASVHGASLTIQIRFFLNAKAAGACPACGYGQHEWDLMSRQVRFSCEGATAIGPSSSADAPATNSLSALCSMAADLAVIQILRFVLKLGQPVADTLLEYNGFTHRTLISPLARSPHCKLDHSSITQTPVDVPLASLSLAELAVRAPGAQVAADVQFEITGVDWVERGACACPESVPLRRFVRRGSPVSARCSSCSAPIVPLSFYSHRTVTASVLGPAVSLPLRALGARRVSGVLIRSGANAVLIRPQPSVTPAP